MNGRQAHWQNIYATKAATEVSWFQETPSVSLDLIQHVSGSSRPSVIDIGGGASRLVDHLLSKGYDDITVLDISEAALSTVMDRLVAQQAKVGWIPADVTKWQPLRSYDIWHDRAVFHFLIEASDRAAYVQRLLTALRPGGHAIIATFAPDGPEQCSGLPVVRYDAQALGNVLGASFKLLDTRRNDHQTPTGNVQRFQFSIFQRE
jgi:trans-aconitate methyltransferase